MSNTSAKLIHLAMDISMNMIVVGGVASRGGDAGRGLAAVRYRTRVHGLFRG
ncbi:MAG: hypothetical protein LC808_22930 [Actinobacteria bacterium]|nr:hypothetical protein [Actinomycetota bacterium]